MQKSDRNSARVSRDWVLDQMLTLLKNGQGWHQGSFAKDKDGTSVVVESDSAVSFDVFGAFYRVLYKYEHAKAARVPVREALIKALNVLTAHETKKDIASALDRVQMNAQHHVTKWQDAPGRQWGEVERLIKLAKEQ